MRPRAGQLAPGGIPRERIDWAPKVDAELCIGCRECLDSCPNGVYEEEPATGTVRVANPYQCVVLCDKCARFCPQDAISFPDKDEFMQTLRRLVIEVRTKSTG